MCVISYISNLHSGTHFLQKDTGESRKKSRNQDSPKCVPEWRFEIFIPLNKMAELKFLNKDHENANCIMSTKSPQLGMGVKIRLNCYPFRDTTGPFRISR